MRRAVHLLGRAFRETGQALDRLGLTIAERDIFNETYARHRPVMNLYDKKPVVAAGVFVAPNASVIGKVLLYNDVSIWYGAVLRGDKNSIIVGTGSNIQDRAVITTVKTLDTGFPAEVNIGDFVTVGSGAVISSAIIGNNVVIGEGAVVEAGVEIGENAVIAPGSVVVRNTLVRAGEFWAGNPAVLIRQVTEEEINAQKESATKIELLSKDHAEEFLPYGTVYQHAEKLGVIKH
eukprot:gene4546-4984_t